MKSIKDNWLIQIEITNVCNFECTNCTRFVGHHRKPYFMDLETIEKAIDSLKTFPGGIGIMGGEPTIHPEFIQICKLLQKKVPSAKRYIWTSGYKWKDYRSIIRKTFAERVYYNEHKENTQKHQPILLAISDLIDDKGLTERLIDQCWIQQMWSPSINPKGGFFCEVAAAMDLLFEGPGGYAIEDRWWDKTPEQFRDQIQRYCYNCGAALPLPAISNKEGKDYVSITNYKKLKELKTPKFIKDRIKYIDTKYTPEQIEQFEKDWKPWEYLGEEKRISFFKMYGPVGGSIVTLQKKINKKCNKIKKCFMNFKK